MSERDSYPAGVPCWVDNLVPDPARAMDFYGELLGWEFDGPGPGDYYVATVRGRDVAGVGQSPPGVSPGWNTYVSVASADDTARAAERVVVEPFDVLPAGRVAALADPGGAIVGLWEPAERRGCQLVNEAAAYAMSALHTPDPDAAARSTATCSDGRPTSSRPESACFAYRATSVASRRSPCRATWSRSWPKMTAPPAGASTSG